MRQFARTLLVLVLAIFYVLFPYDILPDVLGRIGRIDDVLLIFLLVFWYFIKPVIDEMKYKNRYNHSGSFEGENQNDTQTDDPYEILGVEKNADMAAIRRAYQEKIRQYHPDLVAKMGPEIQELARQKSQKINNAYQELKKKKS
jgi:preprotein translocase subunit Sec63